MDEETLDRRSFLIGAVTATAGISTPVAVQRMSESESGQNVSNDEDDENNTGCEHWKKTKNLDTDIILHQKHSNNPVIDGTEYRGNQSYPPSVVRVNNQYIAAVKSYPRLVIFRSMNGVDWGETRTYLRPVRGENENKVSAPLLRYEPSTNRYHIYYGAYTGEEFSIGYQSSMFSSKTTPIYTPADYQDEMGDEVENVILSDVIVVGDEYRFYGQVKHRDGSRTFWTGTGEHWTDIHAETELFDSSHSDVVGNLIQTPNVIEIGDRLLMSYTAGTNADLVGERQIYLAVGEDYDSFEPTNIILVPHSECGTWEERRTYASQWLKKQSGSYLEPETVDGKVRLYYSGHDLGTLSSSSSSGNLGYTGLVEYEADSLLEYV